MNRIVFVDHMGDRREIRIEDDAMAETFYNGEPTGKFHLHEDEVEGIMNAESSDEAFAVIQAIFKE